MLLQHAPTARDKNSGSVPLVSTMGAQDTLVVIGIVLVIVLVAVLSVYVAAYAVDAHDRDQTPLITLLSLVSLQLSLMTVTMLPIDVLNNRGDVDCDHRGNSNVCGTVDMRSMWLFLFCAMAVLLVLFIPFSMQYLYIKRIDSEPDGIFWNATLRTACMVVLYLVVVLLGYFYWSDTVVEVKEYSTDITELSALTRPALTASSEPDLSALSKETYHGTRVSKEQLAFPVDFSVYVAGIVGWVSWWIFLAICPVGMAALPIHLVYAALTSPFLRTAAPESIVQQEEIVRSGVCAVVDVATALKKDRQLFVRSGASVVEKRSRKCEDRAVINKLNSITVRLENQHAYLERCKAAFYRTGNPLEPYIYIITGTIVGLFSLLWWLQMILFVLPHPPPVSPLLNHLLDRTSKWFPLLPIVLVAVLSCYLVICAVVGSMEIGCKVQSEFLPFPRSIRLSRTSTQDFLYTCFICLVCANPAVMLIQRCLAYYSNYSDLALLAGVELRGLSFFAATYTTDTFVWMMVLLFPLIFVLLWATYKSRRRAVYSDDDDVVNLKQLIQNRSYSAPVDRRRGMWRRFINMFSF